MTKQWKATQDVPAILVHRGNGEPILVGTVKTATKMFFRNGECWLRFTDKIETPDVFWDEV